MEKYDVHDKYGNKIGTFEPSFGCDCDELMTIVALLGFVGIAAGIGAILVPIAVIDTFVESALEGWRTPLFVLIPMLVAAVRQGRRMQENNVAADWKMFVVVTLQCAWPALLLGVPYGFLSGEVHNGLIESMVCEDESLALVVITSVAALFPGEIITLYMYSKQKRYRNTRTWVAQGVTLEQVAEYLRNVYGADRYQASVEKNWDGVSVVLEKKHGVAGFLLGLDTGVAVRLSWEKESLIKADIINKEWKSRACAFALSFLGIPFYTGIYGAVKQGTLRKGVLQKIKNKFEVKVCR